MFKQNHPIRRIIYIAIILFTNVIISASSCSDDELYIIRPKQTKGLVLDATNASHISIQIFTGFRTQLWKLRNGSRPGFFYIVSDYTGNVLDFVGEKQLLLNKKEDVLSQQWVLTLEGGIASVGKTGYNIDVPGGDDTPGITLQLFKAHRGLNQNFVLVKKV